MINGTEITGGLPLQKESMVSSNFVTAVKLNKLLNK